MDFTTLDFIIEDTPSTRKQKNGRQKSKTVPNESARLYINKFIIIANQFSTKEYSALFRGLKVSPATRIIKGRTMWVIPYSAINTKSKLISAVNFLKNWFEHVTREELIEMIRDEPKTTKKATSKPNSKSHSSSNEFFVNEVEIDKSNQVSKGIDNPLPLHDDNELIGVYTKKLSLDNKPTILKGLRTGHLYPKKINRLVKLVRRNTTIVRDLKDLYNDTCQICSERISIGNGNYFSEVHHIQPLGLHHGPDTIDNMIVLCPNCHVMFDRGALTLDLNKKEVIHSDQNHKLNGIRVIIKHSIKESYLRYHTLNIFNKFQ